jgi:hypothetical protein
MDQQLLLSVEDANDMPLDIQRKEAFPRDTAPAARESDVHHRYHHRSPRPHRQVWKGRPSGVRSATLVSPDTGGRRAGQPLRNARPQGAILAMAHTPHGLELVARHRPGRRLVNHHVSKKGPKRNLRPDRIRLHVGFNASVGHLNRRKGDSLCVLRQYRGFLRRGKYGQRGQKADPRELCSTQRKNQREDWTPWRASGPYQSVYPGGDGRNWSRFPRDTRSAQWTFQEEQVQVIQGPPQQSGGMAARGPAGNCNMSPVS